MAGGEGEVGEGEGDGVGVFVGTGGVAAAGVVETCTRKTGDTRHSNHLDQNTYNDVMSEREREKREREREREERERERERETIHRNIKSRAYRLQWFASSDWSVCACDLASNSYVQDYHFLQFCSNPAIIKVSCNNENLRKLGTTTDTRSDTFDSGHIPVVPWWPRPCSERGACGFSRLVDGV